MTHPTLDLVDALLARDTAALADLRVRATRAQVDGARELVASLERAVSLEPARFVSDAHGTFTIEGEGRRFHAGRFETRSIASLRDRVGHGEGGRVRVSALTGADVLNDIGALQAFAAEGTLFQVASQFNCLEAMSPGVVPVANYFDDPTQGPRASISAFPGTLLRHHHAPAADGSRFVQSRERQLELLADALPVEAGRVVGGYLVSDAMPDPFRTADELEARWERIAVGVHDDVEVVLGAGFTGAIEGSPRIAQVFTSTFAAGYSTASVAQTRALARPLLRAAYLGTLLAAVAVGRPRVVLTLIGGGVFGNPHALIWEAIQAAVDELRARGHALDVVVNAHAASIAPEVREWIGSTGGEVVDVGLVARSLR